jgi:CheY-like chemotaxis protein
LVDDDADDAEIFCHTLSRRVPGTECHSVENGLQLFDHLSNRPTEKPDIIFLDINMPMMDGWECLKKLKESSSYKTIPTIMYSTSSAKRDIEMAYRLGAQLFVTKPEDITELAEILKIVASHSQESLRGHLWGFNSVKVN